MDNISLVEKDYVYPSLKMIKQDDGGYNFIQDESDNRTKISSAGDPEAHPVFGVSANDMDDN
jgi:hypothetical protein